MILQLFLCVLVPRKTLTFNNKETPISVTSLFHCAVRITPMTMESDECVTCR